MHDKELLELAAKAAGIDLISWTNMYDACDEIGGRFITQPRGEPWNPLEDDGDSLRLAVKLMEFEPYKSRGYLPCITSDAQDTRRAIVRAAAEIGKAMP